MPAAAPKVRRTQEERSAEMRCRLLTATLDCLADLGYAATTTTAVADKAGVSRGAQLHHFPTRASLLAAAVEHLYAGLRADYERAFAEIPHDVQRIGRALALFWQVWHDARLAAVLELHIAARTDPELAAALRPVAREHQHHIARLARHLFPREALAAPHFDAVLDVIQETLRGMAVGDLVDPDPARAARTLRMLEQLAAAALGISPEEP